MKARFAGSMMTLAEAMGNVIEFKDRAEMIDHLKSRFYYWNPTDANVTHEPYSGYDKRTGWHTWLVCIDGKAALFTDGDFTSTSAGEPHGQI